MNSNVEQLNSLLKGELSAVETYDQAIASVKDDVKLAQLRLMKSEHQEAVETLKAKIQEHGGEPEESSGPWGLWAKAVTGIASVLSEDAVLKALKEGEEHGEKEYLETKEKVQADTFASDFLTNHLVKQRQHILKINALMQ